MSRYFKLGNTEEDTITQSDLSVLDDEFSSLLDQWEIDAHAFPRPIVVNFVDDVGKYSDGEIYLSSPQTAQANIQQLRSRASPSHERIEHIWEKYRPLPMHQAWEEFAHLLGDHMHDEWSFRQQFESIDFSSPESAVPQFFYTRSREELYGALGIVANDTVLASDFMEINKQRIERKRRQIPSDDLDSLVVETLPDLCYVAAFRFALEVATNECGIGARSIITGQVTEPTIQKHLLNVVSDADFPIRLF
ncbi:hypothetical protein [Halostella salina]|uniref:hypothetical protein n=1 Tax=Halostella salina TaxID=1547897 RepID=UPI000EF76AFB|nr:hypothetical protein [Halostella salina]